MTKTSRHIELCYSVIYDEIRHNLSDSAECASHLAFSAGAKVQLARRLLPVDVGNVLRLTSAQPPVGRQWPRPLFKSTTRIKLKKKMAGVKRRKSYFSIFTFAEELFEQSTFSNLPKYHFWKKKISRVARPLKTFNSQSDFDFCVRCNVRAPTPPPTVQKLNQISAI